MLESEFKKLVKQRIKYRFASLVLDFIEPLGHNRSMPDLIILGPRVWAALEFKRAKDSPLRPNQLYHVMRMKEKGYATFIFPENLEEVLDELERLFTS